MQIPQATVEAIVLSSIRQYTALLVEQEELRLVAAKAGQIERRLRDEEKAVRLLEESITKHYMALVAGDITQDTFMKKKAIVNETSAHKQAEMERLREQRTAVDDGEVAIQENIVRFRAMQSIETLDRTIVDALIDHILVYGEKDIQIVWADRLQLRRKAS
ncbi:hypothetical protein SDC9_190872 [bioreactor metagenome]|uniref:DUF4368 domain-containing protein n=1 Tax=bioreactor metagenome TaxID=1076179 RepID=A0A645I799_9ZZZZ